MVTANDKQVGGDHYRKEDATYQHWDFAIDNRLGYMEGQITRYITRWKNKNGIEDLEKALHYVDKLYESLTNGSYTVPVRQKLLEFTRFATSNRLGSVEARIIAAVATHNGVANRLHEVRHDIRSLIQKARDGVTEP
jgi:archaellum component FlaC